MSEIVMPAIDIIKLQVEDEKEEELDLPPRFDSIHSVNLNLLDVSYWLTLENRGELCQLYHVSVRMLYLYNSLHVNFGCRKEQSFLYK